MKNTGKIILITLGLLVICSLSFMQASCIVTKDSPAPGCIKSVGIPMAGGCSGKTAIVDLQVIPDIDTIIIKVNNCNGGVLEVRNSSDQLLLLGGVEIEASDYVSLDVIEWQSDGFYSLKDISSNFSDYVPVQDEVITVLGVLGQEQFIVSYTKTKKLCD
jgi:hypothetical protein